MKRSALEKSRTRKVWRKHYNGHVQEFKQSGGQRKVMCRCDLQVNRFRKGQREGGCGQPNCYTCHYEKMMSIPLHRDERERTRGLDWSE